MIDQIVPPSPSVCTALEWDRTGEVLAVIQAGSSVLILWTLTTRKVRGLSQEAGGGGEEGWEGGREKGGRGAGGDPGRVLGPHSMDSRHTKGTVVVMVVEDWQGAGKDGRRMGGRRSRDGEVLILWTLTHHRQGTVIVAVEAEQ